MRRVTVATFGLLLTGCSSVSTDAPPVTPAMIAASGKQITTERLGAGRKLFVSRCIECHSLPAIREHPAETWPGIVDKMSARADLTPLEREAILTYILAVRGQ